MATRSTWAEPEKIVELQTKFGESSKHNFKIVDTIPTPHPYTITPKHLQFNDSMYLGKEQIERMEKMHGGMCGHKEEGWRQCQLKYSEHKQALVVQCKIPLTKDGKKMIPELHKWLLKIKSEAEKEGFDGFAFVDENGKGAKVQ